MNLIEIEVLKKALENENKGKRITFTEVFFQKEDDFLFNQNHHYYGKLFVGKDVTNISINSCHAGAFVIDSLEIETYYFTDLVFTYSSGTSSDKKINFIGYQINIT